MDFDADGKTDILSGSWPGELYWFRREANGEFAKGVQLKDREGDVIKIGHASAPFAADWDGDGDLDLVVGNLIGEVHLLVNEGTPRQPAFGKPVQVSADGKPLKIQDGDVAPVIADWDADGLPDLLVGTGTGSVLFYRNTGTVKEPRLEGARTLIRESPLGSGDDSRRKAGEWGQRVKICVADWNGDGRLDLLLGDRCGGFNAKPTQSDSEQSEERSATTSLSELRKAWASAFQKYRSLQSQSVGDTATDKDQRENELKSLLRQVTRLKEELDAAQKIVSHYKPQQQSHGFVWLFLRKPAGQK